MSKKFIRLQWIAALALAISPVAASAATFTLQNLTASDYDKIVKEFSSDFSYSTVTPASSLGGFGGFELGVIGGKTKSPELYNLVKTADTTTSFKGDLYHGGLIGRIGLPYAFTAEALVFPKKKFNGVSFQETGGAVMWTPTDDLLSWFPVNVSAKLHALKTKVAYSQAISITAPVAGTGTANIAFDDTLWGLQALVSKKFFFVEPYAGLGWVHSKAELTVDASGTTNFFSGSFAQNNKATSSPTSLQVLAGVDARFLFLSVGAEYQKAFGTHSISGRLSFRF